MAEFPDIRLRRLRTSPTLRDMLADTQLSMNDFVAPLFVREGSQIRNPITSMPGQFQYSVDTALETVRKWADLGVRAVLLFGLTDANAKNDVGSEAWNPNAAVQKLTRQIKQALPDMLVITDVCLCEYTNHGHCGTLRDRGGKQDVDNDLTLESLARTAVSHAACGVDIVAPSAMMDGQVQAIRHALDAADWTNTAIMAYSVKFASAMYGPFRDAAESPPQFGDRRTYQMDYRCASQATAEASLDIDEGADIIMVKPAATYLDIIADMRNKFQIPLAAYHVSGEYSQLHAAAEKGWLDLEQSVVEVTTAIKRAGASLIITYFAESLSDWI